jgi:hypothetical protein
MNFGGIIISQDEKESLEKRLSLFELALKFAIFEIYVKDFPDIFLIQNRVLNIGTHVIMLAIFGDHWDIKVLSTNIEKYLMNSFLYIMLKLKEAFIFSMRDFSKNVIDFHLQVLVETRFGFCWQ